MTRRERISNFSIGGVLDEGVENLSSCFLYLCPIHEERQYHYRLEHRREYERFARAYPLMIKSTHKASHYEDQQEQSPTVPRVVVKDE